MPPRGPSVARVMVFVRTPVPGTVKTRLAAEVGEARATRIYRDLAEGTVRRLGASGGAASEGATSGDPAKRVPHWRLEVHFTPTDPASAARIRQWLGWSPEVTFVPQAEGDLGMRMEAALRGALAEGAPWACVVGSDVPSLGPTQVEGAFQALAGGADLVLGPSPDGGYYLVGVRSGTPLECSPLFRDMPWSTDRVLDESLRRAQALGLRVHRLEPLADVDRADDLPAAGRLPEGTARADLPAPPGHPG
jgi:uncharacterized protein